LTGSYHNNFYIYDKNSKVEHQLEATKVSTKTKKAGTKDSTASKGTLKKKSNDLNPDTIDFTKKVLHTAWNPTENLVAVGSANNVLLFSNN